LSDTDELLRGTDPNKADTDGDGVSDGQEVIDGTDPLNASSFSRALGTNLCTPWIPQAGVTSSLNLHNVSKSKVSVTVALLDKNAKSLRSTRFSLGTGKSTTLNVDSLAAGVTSASILCAQYKGSAGALTGTLTETVYASSALKSRKTVTLFSQALKTERSVFRTSSSRL